MSTAGIVFVSAIGVLFAAGISWWAISTAVRAVRRGSGGSKDRRRMSGR